MSYTNYFYFAASVRIRLDDDSVDGDDEDNMSDGSEDFSPALAKRPSMVSTPANPTASTSEQKPADGSPKL